MLREADVSGYRSGRGFFGRCLFPFRRDFSMSARGCAGFVNQCLLACSSRRRPLKDSDVGVLFGFARFDKRRATSF